MISRHFRVPPANASEAVGRSQAQVFDDYCYLTQLQQARCYTTAFGAWRRQMSTAATNMGILYWQLNDVWQGPTWSTIEVDGTPKLSHHATRRAFAPLLISAVEVQSGALPGGVASGGRGRGDGPRKRSFSTYGSDTRTVSAVGDTVYSIRERLRRCASVLTALGISDTIYTHTCILVLVIS